MAGGISGKLTNIGVRAFIAKDERGKKLPDGRGLHLYLTPAGSPTWRIKYRYGGKEKIYSIGLYPQISLAAARVELGEVFRIGKNDMDGSTGIIVFRHPPLEPG